MRHTKNCSSHIRLCAHPARETSERVLITNRGLTPPVERRVERQSSCGLQARGTENGPSASARCSRSCRRHSARGAAGTVPEQRARRARCGQRVRSAQTAGEMQKRRNREQEHAIRHEETPNKTGTRNSTGANGGQGGGTGPPTVSRQLC